MKPFITVIGRWPGIFSFYLSPRALITHCPELYVQQDSQLTINSVEELIFSPLEHHSGQKSIDEKKQKATRRWLSMHWQSGD